MFCSLSGEVPVEPVVNKKSGQLFEKRLLDKHIANGGKDPVTGEPIEEDDILPLKVNKAVKPRPVEAASVPGLLGLFQNEWDALMLETYNLKQTLDKTRQELSHALYQHDAACRVIARLMRERDQARAQLLQTQQQLAQAHAAGISGGGGGGGGDGEGAAAGGMDTDDGEPGISAEISAELQATSKKLSKGRRKRAAPKDLADKAAVSGLRQVASNTVHMTSKPAVLAIDIHPKNANVTLSGGADKQALVFDRSEGKVTATLKGHSKRVTSVRFHPTEDMLLTASGDKTVRVWTPVEGEGGYEAAHVIAGHSAEVTALSLHPTGRYALSASADKTCCFTDINRGVVLQTLTAPDITHGHEAAQFHPDGILLGTGSGDHMVRVWDIREQRVAATCQGHEGPVQALSFSENGYYLATGAADGNVKLWDLRKLAEIKSYEFGSPVNCVEIDHSGHYLAAGGADVRVLHVKEWGAPLCTLAEHSGAVNALTWGPLAKTLVTAGADRAIKAFEVPAEA